MILKTGDLVRLKGDRRNFAVLHVYPPAPYDRWEALIEPIGESWNRPSRLVPTADLTLITDLEDF